MTALARATYQFGADDLAGVAARRDAWRRDRFFVIRDLVPAAPLEALAAEVLAAHAAHAGSRLGGALSGHINFSTGAQGREIAEIMTARGLVELISALQEQPMAWATSGGNLNLPGSHRQHYHMDSNYHDEFVAVMVAMTPISEANGAIELIGESAQGRLRYAEFVARGLRRNGFRAPMNIGDVLVRSSCLWHRGMPNLTQTPRPMLTYGLRPAALLDASVDPFQGEGVRLASNFYSAGVRGALKEALVVHAHGLYSAMRVIKSLFAAPDAAS